MSRCLILLIGTTTLAFTQASALAHRLDADYVRTDQGFRIEFFTGDGSPASALRVSAQLAGGEPIEVGRTDEKGVVVFVPPSAGEWTIIGTGAGHSTSRNPLKISAGTASAPAAASTADSHAGTEAIGAPTVRSSRGSFPWMETIVSLAFIAVLTAVTLLMMRRSAQIGHRHSEMDHLSHDVAHLRAEVSELRTAVAELKAEREVRT